MTPGDLVITVEFTTEADEKTAFLGSLYAGSGVIKPNFARDNYDYTIAVPFGTEEFSISAQAENPYLEPELRQLSPESGVKDLDDELALTEGLNEYTIAVTSQDTKTTQTYNIKVVKLPDLSLADFKITRPENSFERDLAPFDTQSVYVPYTGGITIQAIPNDVLATASVSPASIQGINAIHPTPVTVTVGRTFDGVNDTSLTTKPFVLNLYYGESVDLPPMAAGGYVSFVPAETPGSYYEVHTFLKSEALSFFNTQTAPIQADYLIVAGGGGGGGGLWHAGGGGGGAGGALYKPGETLALTGDSVSVTVGAGGNGGGGNVDGSDGGASSIGAVAVPGGGGGGGSQDANSSRPGRSGGSGGGGSTGYRRYGSGGGASTAAGGVMGRKGGSGSSNMVGGGGGGGAGGEGGSALTTGSAGGSGGAPWVPGGEAEWLIGVADSEFSRGGNGSGTIKGADGQTYGNGGSGGGMYRNGGGAGRNGIVIVRFLHPGNESEPE